MNKKIALIYGDCSSPEIVTQAVRVLDKIAAKHGHAFTYTRAYMGGEAIDKFGDPLPQHELDACLAADSVLLGAVGGPKWEGMPGDRRPEKGLLRLRAGMGLYANNRPAKIWPQLAAASPLKESIVAKGIDFLVVRELIGGVYFGAHTTETVDGERKATWTKRAGYTSTAASAASSSPTICPAHPIRCTATMCRTSSKRAALSWTAPSCRAQIPCAACCPRPSSRCRAASTSTKL